MKKYFIALMISLFVVFSGLMAEADTSYRDSVTGIKLSVVIWRPQQLTCEQLQFAAENFDMLLLGKGEAISTYAKTLHDYNPDIKIFSYINSRQVLNNRVWQQEWESNPDLFATDENDDRIKNRYFDQWLMDIENPEWTDRIIEWANALSPDIDGIFLDDASPTLGTKYQALPAGYDTAQYALSMANVLSEVKNNTPGLVVFNGLREGLEHDGYIDNVDGGLIEGFIFNRTTQNVTLGNVYKHIKGLIEAGETGKMTSVCTKSYMDHVNNRIFALSCYLLGCSEYSTYNFTDRDHESLNSLQYYPEYEIDLGTPLYYPVKPEDLLDPATELAIRHFENGMVIVNPWSYHIDIQLDATYQKITPHGGGIVRIDGITDGYLTYESISGCVTVPEGSAMILLVD